MSQTTIMNHQPLSMRTNAAPTMEKRKRPSVEGEDLHRISPTPKRQCLRRVSWSTEPQVRILENPAKTYEGYDENDIWYSVSEISWTTGAAVSMQLTQLFFHTTLQRQDYEDFLLDRLRTIQQLRASGGYEGNLDSGNYCVRGLEPFQTQDVQQELHSKRRFHRSTILIEQVRQSMLGIHDPERFLVMVGPQSNVSLRRAQELAALDEHEVYGRVCRRSSLLGSKAPSPTLKPKINPLGARIVSHNLSLDQRIQRLQELNARRLMEIYSQPGNNPFRFPLRRDSLLGTSPLNTIRDARAISNRFPIRRDSLTPLGTTGHR